MISLLKWIPIFGKKPFTPGNFIAGELMAAVQPKAAGLVSIDSAWFEVRS